MEIKDKTIALLIDSENISQKYFSVLMEELHNFGDVTYKRIYGDFTSQKTKGWRQLLLEFAIEPMQQYSCTTGKNSTDSAMIIDAMDILYKGTVDCLCLATSDSDFTKLATRFRNEGYTVIGAGEKKTPQSFRAACDRFILMDVLLAEGEGKKEKHTIDNKIIEIAKDIVKNGAESDGCMHFSTFMNELYKKENAFNPKNYGHSNSKPISFFKELKIKDKNIFTLERKNNTDTIRINL